MKLDHQALIAGQQLSLQNQDYATGVLMIQQECLRRVGRIFEDSGPLIQLLCILNQGQILHMWIFLKRKGSSCISVTIQT